MFEMVPEGLTSALEIGCGHGVFGELLKKKFGMKVWGVEIEPAPAKSAANRLDKVLVGDIGELMPKLPDRSFDLIVANDVLEHMVDPFQVLTKLKKKLTKNGYILSSIPNIRNFHVLYALAVGGEWEYQESGILDRTHLRFFTKKSIQKMYERLGYTVITHHGIHPMQVEPKQYRLIKLLGGAKVEDMRYEQIATLATVSASKRK